MHWFPSCCTSFNRCCDYHGVWIEQLWNYTTNAERNEEPELLISYVPICNELSALLGRNEKAKKYQIDSTYSIHLVEIYYPSVQVKA